MGNLGKEERFMMAILTCIEGHTTLNVNGYSINTSIDHGMDYQGSIPERGRELLLHRHYNYPEFNVEIKNLWSFCTSIYFHGVELN